MSDKKGTSFGEVVAYVLICLVIGYALSVVFGVMISTGSFDASLIPQYFTNQYTLLSFGVIEGIALVIGLLNLTIGSKDDVKMKGKDKLENQHFMTESEMEKSFKAIDFNDLKNISSRGIPFYAKFNKGHLKVRLTPDCHCLIVGATGTGKTVSFVEPAVQIISEYKNKPSMFITDPKGEIYAHHSQKLKESGYDVKLLDFVDPYTSLQWNPLESVYKHWHYGLHLERKILKHSQDPVSKYPNLKQSGPIDSTQWFEFGGRAFANLRDALMEVEAQKAKIRDECYDDIQDICTAICPTTNEKESSWEDGARDYFRAIIIAMLEDSENEKLGMTIDKFNFYNAYKIAMNKENDFEFIKQYFNGRSQFSPTRQLTVHITQSQAKTTRDGYMSTLTNKLSMFADNGICLLTSNNQINFGEFDERPTAFFIKIPDEKATRYALASVCIAQSYKEFVRKARDNEPTNSDKMAHLKRPLFYILDEFANMPKVAQLDKMITVGRSRWVYLNMAIQSYAQLDNVYGKEVSATVRGNCKATIFYGTPDLDTREAFSKELGNYTIEVDSKSSGSKGPDGKKSGASTNTSFQTRPLVYASDLDKIPLGDNITKIFQYFPIRSQVTPAFKLKDIIYKYGQMETPYIPGRRLNEQAIFYDIKKRNAIVLGSSTSSSF
ncbi:MAG: type IV secretory system conjugative DNA transfer family protein [Clostridia bacterium]|nr:type IV secretory system conjugative DNA transfer family protein [Clostridia bacterium]